MPDKAPQDRTAFLTRVSGKVVYGAILIEALLGMFNDPLPSSPIILISLLLSLAIVTLVGSYADWVGDDMKRRATPSWRDRLDGFAAQLRERAWVLAPWVIPAAFFGLAMTGLLSQSDAFALARLVLLGVLFFFGFLAARLGGATVLGSVVSALVVTLLGYVVAQVKVLAKAIQAVAK